METQLTFSVWQLLSFTLICLGAGFSGFRYLLAFLKDMRAELRNENISLRKEMRETYKTKDACEADQTAERCLMRIATTMEDVRGHIVSQHTSWKEKNDTQGEMLEVLGAIKRHIIEQKS